jgi:hypothetical protein
MEPDLLCHSQEPATCLYPEPDNPVHASPSNLLKILFNIILPAIKRPYCAIILLMDQIIQNIPKFLGKQQASNNF